MSDDEPDFNFYGNSLKQYDDDAFPKKKPIAIEDQVVTDSKGRRRFHGAFTGGFSAGFFNTVGSLEGWQPSQFKSSRLEKASNKVQRPEDYMDEEDIGEFGIAPQSVRATDDYNTGKKRKKQVASEGPIPGQPVLHMLIEGNKQTIGYSLLRNMGFRHNYDDSSEIGDSEAPCPYEIRKSRCHYDIPQVYKKSILNPNTKSFGLGYTAQKEFINLFGPAEVVDPKKKGFMRGQAFGVGAMEEEDEDIYCTDDLSKYDFELTAEKKSAIKKKVNKLIYDLFAPICVTFVTHQKTVIPTVPQSFIGKHKVRKSRFEAIQPPVNEQNAGNKRADYQTRMEILGEKVELEKIESTQPDNSENKVEEVPKIEKKKVEKPIDKFAEMFKMDKFVSAGTVIDTEKAEEEKVMDIKVGAANLKMFGDLTRVTSTWMPEPIVCRRFNIPEGGPGELTTKQQKRSNIIFKNEQFADLTLDKVESGLHVFKEKETPARKETVINLDEPSTSEIPLPPEPPKPAISITDKLDVSKNTDLYKAIFSDSDSSEDEEVPQPEKKDLTEEILSQDLLPKIKPLKEGILSNVSFIKFIPQKKKETIETIEINEEKTNVYGPKLPEKPKEKDEKEKVSLSFNIDEDDEWVEKSDSNVKNRKHKKKDKKKKHKKKH